MFLTGTTATTETTSRLELFAGTGLTTLLIGMIAVFAILGIIFAALQIMRAIFKKNAIKAKKARKAEEASQKEAAAPVPAPAPAEETAPAADDSAIVAAIVAAISAYTGKAPEGFRVVSFKKRR